MVGMAWEGEPTYKGAVVGGDQGRGNYLPISHSWEHGTFGEGEKCERWKMGRKGKTEKRGSKRHLLRQAPCPTPSHCLGSETIAIRSVGNVRSLHNKSGPST